MRNTFNNFKIIFSQNLKIIPRSLRKLSYKFIEDQIQINKPIKYKKQQNLKSVEAHGLHFLGEESLKSFVLICTDGGFEKIGLVVFWCALCLNNNCQRSEN